MNGLLGSTPFRMDSSSVGARCHLGQDATITEKYKLKMDMFRSRYTVRGIRGVSPEEEKRRLRWKGFAEKGGFKLGVKE